MSFWRPNRVLTFTVKFERRKWFVLLDFYDAFYVIYQLCLLLARLVGQCCFAGCRRRLSSSVTLPAAGRVGGRAADTARRASRVTFR